MVMLPHEQMRKPIITWERHPLEPVGYHNGLTRVCAWPWAEKAHGTAKRKADITQWSDDF